MGTADRPWDEHERGARRQAVIADLAQHALERDDVDALFETATARIRETLACEQCAIFEVEGPGETVRLRSQAESGRTPESEAGATSETVAAAAISRVEPVVTADEHSGLSVAVERGPDGALAVPIGDEPWGALGVYAGTDRTFSEADVAFLRRTGDLLASAIDTAGASRGDGAQPSFAERIVETSPVGITRTDADGTVVFANERAEALLGRPMADLREYVHDDDRWNLIDEAGEPLDTEDLPFSRVAATEESVFDEVVGIDHPDGERVWLEAHCSPLFDDAGEFDGAVYALEDVTEEKHLETELETTFQRITDGFYALDDEWRFTYVNDRAETLLQRPAAELLGERLWELFPQAAEEPAIRDAFYEARARQEPTQFERYFDPLDFWAQATIYPSESGVSVYFQDVTDQKALERRLTRKNHALASLHEISADRKRSFTEKVEALLELGREFLGLGVGFLASIDEDDDLFEVVHAAGGDDRIQAGVCTPLSKTYCRRTIDEADAVAYRDATTADVGEAAYDEWEYDAYLGAAVTVDGQRYGTFCFCDDRPRDRPFTGGELAFVELASQWVGYELERLSHERSLERYRTYTDDIHDAIDDLFYVVDEGGQFNRWNESLAEATGYTDEELDTMAALSCIVPEDRPTVAEGIREVFETGSAKVEAQILTKSGACVPYEFIASSVESPDGEFVLAGIGRDISERKAHERALEASNRRLERFAYAASHDLQEPLRMVSSYLGLIETRYADALDEAGQEFLEFALDGAERMRAMIDGLLAYSRVDSQGDPFEPVDLETVVEAVCRDLEIQIEETDATVSVEDLPTVEGDASQLRQLFQNLMSNAIKYAGDEPPKVYVSAKPTEDERWEVSVSDDGIGIDPGETDRIFDVFQRLHSHDERDGTGIGLALCRRITERHGGEISVDSTPGEGSTFRVTLPSTGSGETARQTNSGLAVTETGGEKQ